MKGLEPPRLSAPDPKSGSATNYDTSAFFSLQTYINFINLQIPLKKLKKQIKRQFIKFLEIINLALKCIVLN